MKLFMILGGLFGFAMGLLLGLAQGSPWPGVFWRASVAALIAGWAMRWWGRIWIRGLVAAHRERQAAEIKAAANPRTARV